MTSRYTLLATLLLGALLVGLSVLTQPGTAHADESNARPSPTSALADPPAARDSLVPQDEFPDLVISAINVFPNTPIVGRPVTVEVVVSNIGTVPVAPSNNFFVDLYINPANPPRACLAGDVFWSVQGFEVGSGSVTLSRTFYPGEEDVASAFDDVGVVTLWAQADTAFNQQDNRCGNVIESRETNNLAVTLVDVDTTKEITQSSITQFLRGFSSALDLTHPLGILQNGTGWFLEPRFPQPEDPLWPYPIDPNEPWKTPTFYNPDYHISVDALPSDFPRDGLPFWNPPDQEHIDVQVGYDPDTLFAVWEDGRNGGLTDRDIYFSYGYPVLGQGGVSNYVWLEPVRVNGDPLGNGVNQLKPQLVVDRQRRQLFVFWQDNRLGNYDIFYARSTNPFGRPIDDSDRGWEEPPAPSNPVNDKEVDPDADQINVTADVMTKLACADVAPNTADCTPQFSYLYVAWEDYRNGNADIFFNWSEDNGTSWLADDIYVRPDPTGYQIDPGTFDQRKPSLFLDRRDSLDPRTPPQFGFTPTPAPPEPTSTIDPEASPSPTLTPSITPTPSPTPRAGDFNYCEDVWRRNIYNDSFHRYPINPLPRVFIVWEDERDIIDGDPYSVYYTRGEFNFTGIRSNEDPQNCYVLENRDNLPVYRFEDDHVRVTGDEDTSIQLNPVGAFDDKGFISYRYPQAYTVEGGTSYSYICEARYPTEELVITWQDNRDGDFDIWSNNIFDDISIVPYLVWIVAPGDPDAPSNPPTHLFSPRDGCLGKQQGGVGDLFAPFNPLPVPELARVYRNEDIFSPQPPQFYELAFPEVPLEISDGLTYTPKPLCPTPNEFPGDDLPPSEQTNPQVSAGTTQDATIFDYVKTSVDEWLIVGYYWNAWDDTIGLDSANQDIFLRQALRTDLTRNLTTTVETSQGFYEIQLQTVQDNVKNQIVLQELDLYETFNPPSAQQANPSLAFHRFDDDRVGFYVGWDDNRNANPLIGFAGNRDVFAARNAPIPMTTASYVSPVFNGNGTELTWYDIEWSGDISVDGVVTLQTRFGLDPNSPEPPQENVVANGWTQWTGIGGTGGFYTSPGQHIVGPTGDRLPTSYYIQYRVNFNPAGGGQDGISCLSEVRLNYEQDLRETFIPLALKGSRIGANAASVAEAAPTGPTVQGLVTDAETGAPLHEAQLCTEDGSACTTTDQAGRYTLPVPEAGIQSVRISLPGFVPLVQPVRVLGDQPSTLDAALTPPLAAESFRAVLTWQDQSVTLEPHLWFPAAHPTHLLGEKAGDRRAQLTFQPSEAGRYTFALFAPEGMSAKSGALVQLYQGDHLVQSFQPPARTGRWWHVFDLEGETGTILPRNQITDRTPAPYGLDPALTQPSEPLILHQGGEEYRFLPKAADPAE